MVQDTGDYDSIDAITDDNGNIVHIIKKYCSGNRTAEETGFVHESPLLIVNVVDLEDHLNVKDVMQPITFGTLIPI